MWVKSAVAFVYTLSPVALGGQPPAAGDDKPGGEPGLVAPKPVSPGPGDAPTPEGPEKKAEEPTGTTAAAARRETGVPFPHPVITEVLFDVPGGDAGDANGDGKRHVSGDEFVELYNPHDKAIQLRGYTLTDSNPADKGRVRFVFPALELPPGGVVVVFNGFQSSWFGPVGDEKGAPAAVNERFHNAWVLTMKAPSQYVAFSNSGDHVLLTAPDGTAVHRVSWGEVKDRSAFEKVTPLLDDAAMAAGKSSVQRDSLARVGSFRAHRDLPFANGGERAFSPGVWEGLAEPKAKKRVEQGEEDQREGGEGREEGEKK